MMPVTYRGNTVGAVSLREIDVLDRLNFVPG